MNDEINLYANQEASIVGGSYLDFDKFIGVGIYESSKIEISDFLTQIGSGNLGSQNLIQSDLTRTFTLLNSEAGSMLSFLNGNGDIALVINGQCDVYNRGLQQDGTSTIFGYNAARGLGGNNNSILGDSSLQAAISGSDNVAFGYNAGRFITGGGVNVIEANCLVAIGSNTRAKADTTINEIIIGCNVTGNGNNTVTIGDGSITGNFFKGAMTIAGLAGVGDRNVVADVNGLLKIAAATNGILSYPNIGSFPANGAIETIYIDLFTDYTYIWDVEGNEYVQMNGETIYNTSGIITDLSRSMLLKTSDGTSDFSILNSSENPIIAFSGDRDIYMDKLKATTGNFFPISIDENGLLSSGISPTTGSSEQFDGSAETIGVAKTLTHGLGTVKVMIQAWDDVTGEIFNPKFNNRTTTEVDITFEGSLPAGNVTVLFNNIN